MNPTTFLRNTAFALAAASGVAMAAPDQAPASDAIEMTKFIVQSVASPTANTIAGQDQIQIQSAVSSPLNVVKYLPGVNLSQGDSIGSDDWTTHITIRGFNENQLGFTVDGVANGFTGYGGGTKPNRYVDIENIDNVVVSQGAGDISSATSQSLGGTLAYTTRDPSPDAGGTIGYTFGSFNASRVFLRGDTGTFAGNTRAYLSFSHGENDNWVSHFVGGSAAVTKRSHVDFKSVSGFGDIKATFYAAFDEIAPEINYQGVTKPQFAQDPLNDLLTFNWTGNPTIDQNYAATWTTWRHNSLVYLRLDAPVSKTLKFLFQPYWHHQTGKGQFLPPYQIRRYDAAGNPSSIGDYKSTGKPTTLFFADSSGADIAPYDPATGTAATDPTNIATYTWLTPAQQAAAHRISSSRFSRYLNNRYGDNLSATWDLNDNNRLLAGMWNEDQERMRHRTWHAVLDPRVGPAYDSQPYADQFHWRYQTLTNMFYAQDRQTFGAATLTGGLKYYKVHVKTADDFILPSGAPGYSTALDSNSKLLPALGVQYALNQQDELFASYTRNFSAVPDSLLEAGASGVDVSKVKPEKSENIDFGYRHAGPNWALSLTGYYIKYSDKLVQLTGLVAKDYSNASSCVWTNIGGTESYGTELAAHYRLGMGFSFLGAFSYTHAEYTANTPDGTITKGSKVVDTPDIIASYGLAYAHKGLEASLMGKYTGRRYGTYSNDNWVGGNAVYDFNAGYTFELPERLAIKSVRFAFTVTNLFDQRYLTSVSTNDQGYVRNDPTGTTMMWNIGAPRTFSFGTTLSF